MSDLNTTTDHAAAGEWHYGAPDESGRYLIEYQQGRVERVFVADYDVREDRWNAFSPDMKVLRWAKINSPFN